MWLLRKLWSGWKKFALVLGTVNRIVFLSIFYWLIIFLANVVIRLLRVDLLDRRMAKASTYWRPREENPDLYEHQF